MARERNEALSRFYTSYNQIEQNIANIDNEQYRDAYTSIFNRTRNLIVANAGVDEIQPHINRMEAILNAINDPSLENLQRLNQIADDMGIHVNLNIHRGLGNF